MTTKRSRGLTRVEVLMSIALGAVSAGVVFPALSSSNQRKAERTRCSSNLRQLGLAAIQYADTQRFFPHVGPKIGRLHGGVETNHGARVVRTLVWAAYIDPGGADAFICPSSQDAPAAPAPAARIDPRRWSWGGRDLGEGAPSPMAVDETEDPTTLATTELSYGWTRKGMNGCARSTAILAADRACASDETPADAAPGLRGNHATGVNLLQVDGTVTWQDGDALARLDSVDDSKRETGSASGYLGIAPLRADAGADERRDRRALLQLALAGLVPAALAGAAFQLLRRRPLTSRGVAAVRASQVVTLGPCALAVLGHDPVAPAPSCAACGDALALDSPLTRCAGCGGVFHAGCVATGSRCPTAGCPGSSR